GRVLGRVRAALVRRTDLEAVRARLVVRDLERVAAVDEAVAETRVPRERDRVVLGVGGSDRRRHGERRRARGRGDLERVDGRALVVRDTTAVELEPVDGGLAGRQ